MSRRIFARVSRGPMDKTAVCVFPWELAILMLVHNGDVEEVSIEEMATQKEGVVKVETQKLKKLKNLKADYPPTLAEQLELMCYVDPEQDPALDPQGEYNRLVEKYGMDKDVPFPVATRIYGEFGSGAFEAKVKEFAEDSIALPAVLKKMAADQAAEDALDEPAPAPKSARSRPRQGARA